MFRSHWLQNLLGVAHSRKDRRCQAAKARHGVQLMLEPLEDRITPSAAFTYKPSVAVGNALKSETDTTTYLLHILNSYISILGAQAGGSSQGNGSAVTAAGQNNLNSAFAVLFQDLTAISKELFSTNFQNNPMGLLQLELQLQQLQQTGQSPAGQPATPPSNIFTVSSLAG